MNNEQSIIKLEGIKKTYQLPGGLDVPVLKGIDLDIKQGEFVALMGESGGGKTTLLNIIGLLHYPTDGNYYYLDE
ncbi:MAG: ATP-binding cassette domain-containing protein, partial [Candidatus Pacebacteria bacterium]|nr:ATP-binding cassette domain-containing protein [Candidatus Paceibacterota bacterium]